MAYVRDVSTAERQPERAVSALVRQDGQAIRAMFVRQIMFNRGAFVWRVNTAEHLRVVQRQRVIAPERADIRATGVK